VLKVSQIVAQSSIEPSAKKQTKKKLCNWALLSLTKDNNNNFVFGVRVQALRSHSLFQLRVVFT